MSSKRRAQIQISNNPNAAFDDDRDQDDDTPIQASQQVLAARKIAVPRKRLATAGSANGGNQNPFAAAAAGGSGNPFSKFGQPAPAAPSSPPPSKVTQPHENEYKSLLYIRALNTKFKNSVNSRLDSDPLTDLQQLCRQYISYSERNPHRSTISGPASSSSHNSGPPLQSSSSTSTFSSFTSTQTQPTTGFNFGNSSKPDFKFGSAENPFASKSLENAKQENGSEKEESSEKDNHEKLASDEQGKDNPNEEKEQDHDEEDEDEEEKPKNIEIKGPSFSFGKPASFSLGQIKKEQPKEEEEDSDSEDDVEIKGPSFSLSQVPKSDKPAPFSFNLQPAQPQQETTDKRKEEDKGTASATLDEKPSLFRFNGTSNHTWTPEKGIKFGQSSSSDQNKQESGGSKPTFSFGAVASSPFSTAKPPSSSGIGFSFGTSSSAPVGPASSNKEAPKPFTFGGASSSSTPQFGGFQAAKPSENDSNPSGGGDAEDKEITAGSVTDLSAAPGPGEENETAVYEHRCKVLKLNKGDDNKTSYDSAGLGTARILKHNDTKKLRILVRAEGSGRVILNVALQHDEKVDYPIIGNNNVRILNFSGDGSLETYLVRVKTADDAKKLKSAIDDNR